MPSMGEADIQRSIPPLDKPHVKAFDRAPDRAHDRALDRTHVKAIKVPFFIDRNLQRSARATAAMRRIVCEGNRL